ncbi:hypothetical protein [Roseisolibacter sp. H3M3-2]|uniref:hypothetical protein n=1 Tax=Roseisolibacter sp. H3M3-2 TaxID=3031323 RepID=UPI0023DCB40F|nr:hypothetical protein [Roseisolibacter sp. H3M3-2]MDF1504885.1 hypothetical protein [Roseisolibacter sp. H3M3-2]
MRHFRFDTRAAVRRAVPHRPRARAARRTLRTPARPPRPRWHHALRSLGPLRSLRALRALLPRPAAERSAHDHAIAAFGWAM